jgi:hypothetical protein
MLTIFYDIKTNKVITETYKFESIPNALKKTYRFRNRRYTALRQIVELDKGIIIQTINLLQFPEER